MGSRMYAARGGKVIRFGRDSVFSPRRKAAIMRHHLGGQQKPIQWSSHKPKRGRRKLGARRKVTLIESVFRWIKVPTGKVGRRTRRA